MSHLTPMGDTVAPADETFHIAVTFPGAVRDRANGNILSLEEAQAELEEIRKHTPDTRLTIFRVAMEVVQP